MRAALSPVGARHVIATIHARETLIGIFRGEVVEVNPARTAVAERIVGKTPVIVTSGLAAWWVIWLRKIVPITAWRAVLRWPWVMSPFGIIAHRRHQWRAGYACG